MCCVGLFLALLLERCLFVDFPFYNQHFAHELDFSWTHHRERLLRFGHDPNATENQPERIPFGYDNIGGACQSSNHIDPSNYISSIMSITRRCRLWL